MAEDVFSMRQDAVRRAREMYSRARPGPQEVPSPGPAREAAEHTMPSHPPQEQKTHEAEKGPDGFEAFFKDKEKMMILALLVILSQESCDNSLLFSLMFLLL